MTEVFCRTADCGYKTLKIANVIEGFVCCDIISINNLGINGWEIWAKYNSDAVTIETIDAEIRECLKYMDAY